MKPEREIILPTYVQLSQEHSPQLTLALYQASQGFPELLANLQDIQKHLWKGRLSGDADSA